jgi:hypothetical protein
VTSSERLISALIAAHLAALLVVAIPSPGDAGVQPPRPGIASPVPALSRTLDAVAESAAVVERAAWQVTTPLRYAAKQYESLLVMQQRWDMFANPIRSDWHARVVYRIRRADGSVTSEEERVFPNGALGWKFVAAYRASFLDKAFSSAVQSYQGLAAKTTSQTPTPEMAAVFEPFTRYFTSCRVQRGLPDGQTIVATEFWWGVSDLPAPSSSAQTPSASIRWQLWAVDDLQ